MARCAVFVLPMSAPTTAAPVAAWATTAGWASGAEQALGAAWVASDSGIKTPDQAARQVVGRGPAISRDSRGWRRLLPEPPITLMKDLKRLWRGRTGAIAVDGPWRANDVAFVWQRHELFRRDGLELSRELGVPFVLSVHAMQVQEARSWGVRRPGWERLAERIGELPNLRAADVIACVSQEVAAAVVARGIDADRVLVTPNGVDVEHFRPRAEGHEVRQRLGVEGKFVVGWSGSFRRFHGLDLALEAWSRLAPSDTEAVLLLIGDGQERATLERRVRQLGLSTVIFAGSVAYEDMPRYLSACDVGLLLSPPSGQFHFSPVKLREYMACGLPVIAPALGELQSTLVPGRDAELVPPNDVQALAAAVERLRGDEGCRRALAQRARSHAEQEWSWAARVEQVLSKVEG